MALVFGYGRTSTADTAAMAAILMAFAPGLIALSGQYVLSRAFYALSDTRTPFLLNLVIVVLNAGLSLTAAYVLAGALGRHGHGSGILTGAVRGLGADRQGAEAGGSTSYAPCGGRPPRQPTHACCSPPSPPPRWATSRPSARHGREPWPPPSPARPPSSSPSPCSPVRCGSPN